MGRNRPKRTQGHHNVAAKMRKTRSRTRDLDQIQDDVVDPEAARPKLDPDLPGMGAFYCMVCAKHCINEFALKQHFKARLHKRRVKEVQEEKYTQKDANRAAGLGAPDNGR